MNPFSDALRFLSGNTNDFNALGGWKYLLLAILYALLAASVVIAIKNWSEDPAQRTARHAGTWLIRVLVGAMWFEGMLWKLPFFTTENGLYFWTQQMAGRAAFEIHREFVANVILPNFLIFDPLVFLAELTFAASLILGLGVRLVSSVALIFVLNLWLGIYNKREGDPTEWSWTYMFLALLHLFFVLYAAGRALGFDAWLRRRVVGVRDSGGSLISKLVRIAS